MNGMITDINEIERRVKGLTDEKLVDYHRKYVIYLHDATIRGNEQMGDDYARILKSLEEELFNRLDTKKPIYC